MSEALPTFDDVRAAAARLAGRILRTPLLRHPLLDEIAGATVLVKPEPLQRTGSFKLRGATNAALLLDAAARRGGIVTHSSGNHGQACAAAAHMLGMKATIAMPSDAPAIKVAATQSLGRRDHPPTTATASTAKRWPRRWPPNAARPIIPPFDHPHVIAGQGTVALELIEDAAALGLAPDAVAVCTGGGGLTAGCVLALEALAPEGRGLGGGTRGLGRHAALARGRAAPGQRRSRQHAVRFAAVEAARRADLRRSTTATWPAASW